MPLWGKTDTVTSVPTYLSEADAANAYFVDTTEAGVAVNKAKGLGTSGWNLYTTYTDSDGATRNRTENLIAMRVTAGNAGDVGAIAIAATAMTDNTLYTIVTAGTTDFTLVGAVDSNVGTSFTSDLSGGPAIGTGTVAVSDDSVIVDA